MTRLRIKNLQVHYGSKLVLNNINLAVKQGEMMALLGPSGCGKTTLLNALCGFVPITQGDIFVSQKAINPLPAEKRNITMVFQSYALWPHMSVAQNIGYGLRVQKIKTTEIKARVKELLDIVKLTGLESTKVTSLSGGQRQRVALARALAIRPDVLVLDEPLSNLDAKVRLSVRHEIKALQKQLGFTSLIVTHDQEEALVMADRIAILHQGKIEQVGIPKEIYHQPSNAFVANFMGADNHVEWPISKLSITQSPPTKHLYFRSEEATLTTYSHSVSRDNQIPSSTQQAEPLATPKTKRLEQQLTTEGLTLLGKVTQSAFFGHNYRMSVCCGEHTIQADHPIDLPVNTPVILYVPSNRLHIYDKPTEQTDLPNSNVVSTK